MKATIKLKYFILVMAIAMIGISAQAQKAASDEDSTAQKIRAAVMKVYDDQLAETPDAYDVRYARAMQLYFNGDYAKSLDDINIVISQCPEKEADQLYDALILRAKLYDAQGNTAAEAQDLQRATAINPSSLNGIDLTAKLALKQGNLTEAESGFNAILRQSPQNYDAFYGLAQVEAQRGNNDKAIEFCDRAVKLFPQDPTVYYNRANVYKTIGAYENAAEDYIIAMSLSSGGNKGIAELWAMSNAHYDAVMSALQRAIDNAPRQGNFYYLRAEIAKTYLHYGQALHDFNIIIDNNFYDDYTIYEDAARCQFELTMYDEALKNVNKALQKSPTAIDAYVLKAQITRYQGTGNNYALAISVLKEAEALKPNYAPVLIAEARNLYTLGQKDEAMNALNKVIAADPHNNEALLLRGFISKYRLRKPDEALADFSAMLANGDNMASLRGFALHEIGKDEEARQWARKIIADNPLPGGEAYYYAAALLSDIDPADEQALKYFESALANGFGSKFLAEVSEEYYVNLKLLRRNENFATVLNRYTDNFEVK